MTSSEDIQARAHSRCEYCKMHQSLQDATFHIEHVIPRSRGGTSEPSNLAWACPSCNLHKSDRVECHEPQSGESIPLFNPRVDCWHEQFAWNELNLVGRTVVGRVTIHALQLNHPRRLRIREAEQMFGLFPPDAVRPK